MENEKRKEREGETIRCARRREIIDLEVLKLTAAAENRRGRARAS
jgi:hypothetical protein